MPKSMNQKLKLLYLQKILLENTDEEHTISMDRILTLLANKGIDAERKSIYSDIEELNNFGMDILCKKGKNGGYYVASREFEFSQIRLLVDIVQSAKFITEKKSNELIKKLEMLVSSHEAYKLQAEVYVANRVKTDNETIYYLVHDISEAMNQNRKITFKYLEWSLDKQLVPKKDGALYKVSPWMLSWDDENYYLVAFDDEAQKIKHYRIDKMKSVTVIDEHREGKPEKIDVAVYSKKVFGMYGGEEERVTLECDNSMIGIIMDRFGSEVIIRKKDGSFEATVNVMISPQFLAWIVGFCGKIRSLSPEKVCDELKTLLNNTLEGHK